MIRSRALLPLAFGATWAEITENMRDADVQFTGRVNHSFLGGKEQLALLPGTRDIRSH